jgi:Mg-chelatase subunit ChlD
MLRLERAPCDLAELARRAVDLYDEVAQAKGQTLTYLPGGPVPINGDAVRLRQVVANLVDNACKYTPAGGRIEVRVAADGGRAVLTVSDNGPGVPAAEQPRIWERLYRGDKSRSEAGLGLGLSLVRAVVVAHGGEVAVRNAPAGGAVFEVRVSHGRSAQTVRWQRGQRDALQVRLDGAAPARARLDLVFAIDATGSMADEIAKLKHSMREVADRIAALPQAPDLCFGLVAYRDRGDAFFVRGADLTHDLGAFQAELAALQAGGGGDYPEAMAEALHTAVHRLSWRGEGTARLVVLLADAPPQRRAAGPHIDHEARAALARGIKIVSVGASGLDREGELAMRLAAQATGGRFVFLTYANRHDPSSGPGRETVHDVRDYSVETLDKLIVRLVSEELAGWPAP